jgi:hypothetical protein
MIVSSIDRHKTIVKAFYEGGRLGKISSFADLLDESFLVSAPGYLPWGGVSNKRQYLDIVLPQVGKALDFSRLEYVTETAEGDRVIVLIDVGISGTESTVKISEHWCLRSEKAISLWVAYYEPNILLAELGKASLR